MESRTRARSIVAGAWLVAFSAAVFAQDAGVDTAESDALPAGHSRHGEAFNQGPRQRAYLMGGTGEVHFPITTASEEAQQFFDQGVGQLHGFWYFEAERSFRQVAALDPRCRMAYWGMAMANFENEGRARGFIERGLEVEVAEEMSARERAWYDAEKAYVSGGGDRKKRRGDLIQALERIVLENPEDLEAKAFLVVRLWQLKGDLPIQSHVAVDSLIREVLAANPAHPIHHYKIHLWDSEKSDEALRSAALCGQSAPAIAHMWHMPGHIFSKLRRYEDAVWQQEASARVDHAHMMRDHVLPDQIHNYAHNNEWLIRNLIFVGRVRDAIDLAKNMLELPRHPDYNTLDRGGRSASYGRERLFQVLETFELWEEMIALAETVYLEPSDREREEVKRLRLIGRAHFGLEDRGRLGASIAALEERLGAASSESDRLAKEARDRALLEGKSEDDAGKAAERAGRSERGAIGQHEAALAELRFYDAVLAGEMAPEELRERLADVDGLSRVARSRLWFRLGDEEKALDEAGSEVDANENEVVPLANRADLLARAGRMDEAKEAMRELRPLCAYADIDTPPFRRLAGLAAAMGFGEDWRPEPVILGDIGDRPELDALGPFRWSPYAAPDWTLADTLGREHSLARMRGRPALVIFYLGYGCLHCAEQLRIFAPCFDIFAGDGIEVVAISSEGPSEVAASLDDFLEGAAFPIPLLPDPELEVFRRYRAYDDFEGVPLHGTFLIDPGGRVLWQDISYEPFNAVDFLIREARRLLGKNARERIRI